MTTLTTGALNAASLSSSAWTEKTLHVKIPAVIPADLKLSIQTSGVSASGIYLDGGLLQPYTYWSGLGWAATLGGDPFALGDKFNLTITNNKSGPLQTFLARAHGFQLPSA